MKKNRKFVTKDICLLYKCIMNSYKYRKVCEFSIVSYLPFESICFEDGRGKNIFRDRHPPLIYPEVYTMLGVHVNIYHTCLTNLRNINNKI